MARREPSSIASAGMTIAGDGALILAIVEVLLKNISFWAMLWFVLMEAVEWVKSRWEARCSGRHRLLLLGASNRESKLRCKA